MVRRINRKELHQRFHLRRARTQVQQNAAIRIFCGNRGEILQQRLFDEVYLGGVTQLAIMHKKTGLINDALRRTDFLDVLESLFKAVILCFQVGNLLAEEEIYSLRVIIAHDMQNAAVAIAANRVARSCTGKQNVIHCDTS